MKKGSRYRIQSIQSSHARDLTNIIMAKQMLATVLAALLGVAASVPLPFSFQIGNMDLDFRGLAPYPGQGNGPKALYGDSNSASSNSRPLIMQTAAGGVRNRYVPQRDSPLGPGGDGGPLNYPVPKEGTDNQAIGSSSGVLGPLPSNALGSGAQSSSSGGAAGKPNGDTGDAGNPGNKFVFKVTEGYKAGPPPGIPSPPYPSTYGYRPSRPNKRPFLSWIRRPSWLNFDASPQPLPKKYRQHSSESQINPISIGIPTGSSSEIQSAILRPTAHQPVAPIPAYYTMDPNNYPELAAPTLSSVNVPFPSLTIS